MRPKDQVLPDAQPRSRSLNRSELIAAFAVLAATALAYGAVFNRETTLSYSIGYNLYGAERVLDGEVPYRDFHTLYPPATIYLNAALFKLFGVELYSALAGVLVFKVLTIVAIYLCGREVLPRGWALAAWFLALIWLRPNGPFKTVPMHYGALFLAAAMYCLLRFRESDSSRAERVLAAAAGFSLGMVALFKHNIALYALAGVLLFLVLDTAGPGLRPAKANLKRWIPLMAGFVLPLAPVGFYIAAENALGTMIRALLFGPGEFLIGRLRLIPSPLVIAGLLFGFGGAYLFTRWSKFHRMFVRLLWIGMLAGAVLLPAVMSQSFADGLLFSVPLVVLGVAVLIVIRSADAWRGRGILIIAVITAAAFMETFPRFAREQVIAAMPFVALLAISVLYGGKRYLERVTRDPVAARCAAAVIPIVMLVTGVRLLAGTYLNGFAMRSDTLLSVERGQGVYFPRLEANEIEEVVRYLRERIPEDGQFFAQSYAGSAYLFLADRRNPSGAQFWGGVGVTDEEKERTLAAVERNQVRVVVTSPRDLAAERYQPMKRLLETQFAESLRVGDVVVLERVKE
jgi:hypothetical protein